MGILSYFTTAKPEPQPERRGIDYDDIPWMVKDRGITNVSIRQALSIPAVHAAVSSIADLVSGLPVNVYEKTAGGWKADEDHYLAYLLNESPNPYQTAKAYRFSKVVDLLSAGEHFSEIEGLGSGEAKYLWRLEPGDVTTQWGSVKAGRGRSTVLRYYVIGQEIDPANLTHVLGFTLDGYRGTSPFELCKDSLSLTLAMQRFGLSFFRKGARPGGILNVPPGLPEEDRVKSKQAWQDAQAGADNAGDTAVLPDGFKYSPMSLAPEEAQYHEGRIQQMRECGRVTRAAPHMFGDLERATWSNIDYMGEEVVRSVIRPLCIAIQQEWNRKFFGRGSRYYIEHDLTPLTEGTYRERVDTAVKAAGGPVLTVDEARARLDGLPPIPGGDKLLNPVNMADASNKVEAQSGLPVA